MGKTVRCKFRCTSVTKQEGWGNFPVLYSYKMQAVSDDGTAENKQFYAVSPSGMFDVSAVREDHFEVGKQYYFDISLAEAVPA